MDVGKLPSHLLEQCLAKVPVEDRRVLLGPAVGEDAAVVEMGGVGPITDQDTVLTEVPVRGSPVR